MDSGQKYHLNDLTDHLWRIGELRWKLHSTQKKIHDQAWATGAEETLILASRQLGKSYWASVFALEWCLKHPGSIVRIMAATLKQIQDIVADNIGPITQDAPKGLIERQKTSYRWSVGQSSLRLGPLERSNVDYNRGGNASLIITEEGGFVSSDDYEYAVRSVIGPQLLRSGGKLVHVTSPSSDPLHYIHSETLPKTALTNTCFRFTVYDNPQITHEQLERAKDLCGGEDSAAWKREYLAQIIRDATLVIVPEFNRERHVIDFALPNSSKYFVAIDWGGVRDKTVGLLYTYDFLRNKVLVIAEFTVEPNTETGRILAIAKDMERHAPEPVLRRIADVNGQSQIDINSQGYAISVPIKDDWQAGINNMQVMFARGEIEIHPRCKFLIQSLESGQYNKNRTDFNRTEVLGHCDALAALMYALRGVDRTSPYNQIGQASGQFFTTPGKVTEEQKVAQSIQPKTFVNDFGGSGIKRFGTFRR